MLKKAILPSIFILLGYGFWISPNFKEIASGIAIFLFGMLCLEEGFKAFSGGALERVLQKSTNKTYKSISFGFIATILMQSSSLVSVLTISFLGAGLIELVQGIGIMFGANIGTTSGTWLMGAFGLKINISAYAMPMLVFGILSIMQKNKSLKGFGYILTGLGFLFLGIHYMKEGFEAFKESIDIASYVVDGKKGMLIFIGIGVIATFIMQSSHATMVLNLTALSMSQITYENSVALSIGAAIGTTITAVIGSLSSNTQGKRLAGAHFMFNIVNALLAIFLINYILIAVGWIADFAGIAQNNHPLRLAVFDTFYKVSGVILFLPFVKYLEKFLNWVFKDKDKTKDTNIESIQFLNDSVLELPTTSLAAISNETRHLYNIAFKIIANGLILKQRNILANMSIDEVIRDEYVKEEVDVNREYLARVKDISGVILDFATRAQHNMNLEQITQIYNLKLANRSIVAAIKATQHLCKNMKLYTKSSNQYVRDEYNLIRKNLVKLLRVIHKISISKDESEIVFLLAQAKLHMEQNDIFANGSLDSLIREEKIPNSIATALMNDSSYVYDISHNLIATAEVLFADNRLEIEKINKELFLNEDDIDEFFENERPAQNLNLAYKC